MYLLLTAFLIIRMMKYFLIFNSNFFYLSIEGRRIGRKRYFFIYIILPPETRVSSDVNSGYKMTSIKSPIRISDPYIKADFKLLEFSFENGLTIFAKLHHIYYYEQYL